MHVYRITVENHAGSLIASGHPAWWNTNDSKMIYTASSKALARLDNVVHCSALGLQRGYCGPSLSKFRRLLMTIH